MKNLIRNLKTYGLLTILMVGGLIIAFSAFKAKEMKRIDQVYYFDSNNANQANDPEHWKLVDPGLPSCGTTGSIPCTITVPSGQTLEDYLSPRSAKDVLDDASSRRD